MNAMPAAEDQPHDADDLLAEDASPAEIAAFLLPEDRARFRQAYERALDEAKETLDLSGIPVMLDEWRGLALLQADREDFARLVRTSAERLTGTPIAADEPLSVTRARVGI